ncbi:hypothetical protein [Marivita hallyeonensis]|uniref:Uncharacterized protein n=1 Tax=Marivita hallyeonensis TaxID=996342 RepID=A0A1M5S667_9RHOB|nr:hypothetical protein [Marivita hallyeonensis]SHH33981.1 hypothetical protein SAMN05443551_2019 [Marivita hallyeonensis]
MQNRTNPTAPWIKAKASGIATVICLSLPSAHPAAAEILPDRYFEEKLSNTFFEAEIDGRLMDVMLGRSGRFALRSPLGTFDGSWRIFQGEICVDMLYGPMAGFRCKPVNFQPDGSVHIGTDITLKPAASARFVEPPSAPRSASTATAD